MKQYFRLIAYLKPYLWPQGAIAVVCMLGFSAVEDVHMGRYIELDLADDATESQVRAMCQQLLANPVIEQYSITMGPES